MLLFLVKPYGKYYLPISPLGDFLLHFPSPYWCLSVVNMLPKVALRSLRKVLVTSPGGLSIGCQSHLFCTFQARLKSFLTLFQSRPTGAGLWVQTLFRDWPAVQILFPSDEELGFGFTGSLTQDTCPSVKRSASNVLGRC